MVLFFAKVSKPNSVMTGNSLFQDHPMVKYLLIMGKYSHIQTPCKVFFCFSNTYVTVKASQYTDLHQRIKA